LEHFKAVLHKSIIAENIFVSERERDSETIRGKEKGVKRWTEVYI
jgi:hypothetical protein